MMLLPDLVCTVEQGAPSTDAWQRIMDFCSALYMRHSAFTLNPIDAETWVQINKRYKSTAARGPDVFSGRDLLWMPSQLVEQLVEQVNDWETLGSWPTPLRTGFVHPLAKRDPAPQVGDYRPIIVFSTIYRSWSSLRSRQILRRFTKFVSGHQFGFMPNCEASEIWLVLQGPRTY